MVKKLTETQIQRLYNVFDFENEEEIVDSELVGDHTLLIHYIDNRDGSNGTYIPDLENDEGLEKLNFIMNGIELNRE